MNMYTNGFMPAPGMVPNQYQQKKTINWLPAEDLALLQKGLSQFKLSVTKEELAKGQCNHYDSATGSSTLIPDADGSGGCTCGLCGTHFYTKDFSAEEIKNATENILDILNTIKIMYLSLDPNAALEYFQIIPFIEKIPDLYNIAVQDFKRYEGIDSFVPGSNGYNVNPFNIYAMMTQPGWGMVPPQQQMYGFNPNMNAGFAQQNPQFNPIFAGGYQPQTQGFSMNPVGAAAPQQGFMNTNMPNAMNPTGQAATPQQGNNTAASGTTENK